MNNQFIFFFKCKSCGKNDQYNQKDVLFQSMTRKLRGSDIYKAWSFSYDCYSCGEKGGIVFDRSMYICNHN